MNFDQFAARLCDILEVVPSGALGPEVGLYDDLALDSLQAFELLIAVESLASCDLPPPEIPELYTLADAFAYYTTLRDDRTTL